MWFAKTLLLVELKTPNDSGVFGGLVRIRTGVDGFADRCLTARPRDHCDREDSELF